MSTRQPDVRASKADFARGRRKGAKKVWESIRRAKKSPVAAYTGLLNQVFAANVPDHLCDPRKATLTVEELRRWAWADRTDADPDTQVAWAGCVGDAIVLTFAHNIIAAKAAGAQVDSACLAYLKVLLTPDVGTPADVATLRLPWYEDAASMVLHIFRGRREHLRRLRCCANARCRKPYFIDGTAGAGKETCSLACRKARSRSHQKEQGHS